MSETVSDAIKLPRGAIGKRLARVMELVDQVHSDGELRTVAVMLERSISGGKLSIHGSGGPDEIRLDPEGDHLELSFLHEIGHLIEWRGIPKKEATFRDFRGDLLFTEWLAAVRASRAVQDWIDLRNASDASSLEYEAVDYLLLPAELWARSYSQYIVRKSNQAILSDQIANENKKKQGTMQCNPYWTRDDFAPILKAMARIFSEQGWI